MFPEAEVTPRAELKKSELSANDVKDMRLRQFAYIPLIPLGSYRVVRSTKDDRNPKVTGKEKLQWDQVLDGWKRAAIIALLYVALIIAVVLWDRYREW